MRIYTDANEVPPPWRVVSDSQCESPECQGRTVLVLAVIDDNKLAPLRSAIIGAKIRGFGVNPAKLPPVAIAVYYCPTCQGWSVHRLHNTATATASAPTLPLT
jgi:hypothetical protein